ncbi:MAG: amidohydrolase [Nitrospirota bacterium]
MESVDYIVRGDYVLTIDERMDTIVDGAVAVKDRRIIDVAPSESILRDYQCDRIVGGEGRVVLPGLINTHTHAAMVYFRGLADDLPLKVWLEEHIWPAENSLLSSGFVADAIELACVEMLKAGITTYNDMYFFGGSAAASTKKLGMRAVLGVGILDFPTMTAKTIDEYLDNAERFIEEWKGDELITPCIAPHSAYACGPETLQRAMALAERHDVLMSIHLSETEWEVGEIVSKYGKRPVEHLAAIGVLNRRVVAAHCVWVDEHEIALLAEREVGVSHCLESNLKLASGIAPVPRMLAAGVKVSFGTDGAASNNDLNILSELSTAAKLHKTAAKDPTVLDSKTALLMATRWGAEVLGMGSSIGSIAKGKKADLITINLRKPHLLPLYDVYSHIVYAARASDVESVLVDGRLIINGGSFVDACEQDILHKAMEWGERIALYNSR